MNSVVVHGVLAVAGLLFAYQTYTRVEEQEELPGQVTLLECEPNSVSKLELESATQLLTLSTKKHGEAADYWLTAARKKKPEEKKAEDKDKPDAGFNVAETKPADAKPADAKPADAKPADVKDKKGDAKDANAKADAKPEPEKPEPEKPARAFDADAPVTFLANSKFAETIKTLAPLRAMRGLGEIPKDKFEQFGFDKVETRLRMECGGRKLELEIGGRTFGAGDRYSRDPKTKQAYLLPGQVLTDLESAKYKFMQNELNRFTLADVDEAVVKALGKERRLTHRNRLTKDEARWVDAAAPDKRNELFNTWFQRVGRLKAKSYLGEGADPGSDLQVEASGSAPVVTIEYRLEGKPKGKLEIARVDTKKEGLYYARTETTGRWVVLYDSLAKQVEDDVAMVVGAEEQPAEAPPAAPAAPGAHDVDTTKLPPGHPKL
jgi:hypothetical protein